VGRRGPGALIVENIRVEVVVKEPADGASRHTKVGGFKIIVIVYGT
jgi:hypothetical protein